MFLVCLCGCARWCGGDGPWLSGCGLLSWGCARRVATVAPANHPLPRAPTVAPRAGWGSGQRGLHPVGRAFNLRFSFPHSSSSSPVTFFFNVDYLYVYIYKCRSIEKVFL